MSTSSVDKQWAKKYILDPLTAPEPSQECGPGSSFVSPTGRSLSVRTPKDEKRRRKDIASAYPSPPASSSPTRSAFRSSQSPTSGNNSSSSPVSPNDLGSSRRPGFGRSSSSNYVARPRDYPPSASIGRSQSQSVRRPPPSHQNNQGASHTRSTSNNFDKGKGLTRSNSLSQRYPGDMSHRPLDIIKRDVRAADRAPHLRKSGMPRTDIIDSLDTIGGTYHHGGPFDATLAARNTNKMYAPVEALKDSNMEAIRATPREFLQDSLQRHVPLQGTSQVPPGATDFSGNVMDYEEGADLMRERDAAGGAYKRWDGIPYHPDDLKGKGEPSYTIERDHKEQKARRRRNTAAGENGNGNFVMEMQPRQTAYSSGTRRKDLGAQVRQRSISSAADGGGQQGASSSRAENPFNDSMAMNTSTDNGLRRSNTTGNRLKDGLKRRFGSLRRKKNTTDDDYY
ncbi:hypothetical protein MCOR25_003697 [Pyricularia grisea]|uniref:Uncharacterized protein n=1 Tax=Pyricularia grisea TaxID=148305 RepID=A0A6P8AV63_PYRGI|nr:uncharacterized protein PgNI_08627 [Pyricularia grisea]KAI6372537.1 hypothetical protein MCOR25_003697 [Pyricularia grisea]TLD06111.1 hypothetical protein PgNI_08627 [Pyricularia grisea]